MKNFLLIGNSALEDAIAWKLNKENNIGNIFISPGNGGCYFKQKTRNINLNLNDKNEISDFLNREKINLIINSSYNKLTEVFDNLIKEKKIEFIGPDFNKKSFFNSRINIRNFFKKYNVLSPPFEIIESIDLLSKMIEKYTTRKIIYTELQKSWKGSYIIESKGQGIKTLEAIEESGEKDGKFIIENYQKGEEFSATIALDGISHFIFPVIRVYPKSFDYDYGLYTSGMGAFTPCPSFTNLDLKVLEEKIINPIIEGLKEEALNYCGFLTVHFIKTGDKLLALNMIPSIHSPEIETIITLMDSSFNNLCESIINQDLKKYVLKMNKGYSISIVLASKGYPINSEKGVLIAGLEKNYEDINIFHNRTSRITYSKNRGFVTNGGRVVILNTVKSTLENAKKRISDLLQNNEIFFSGNFYRNDIAEKYCKN